jgi:NADH-quinone oxidoreductase subunit K
MTPRTFLVLAAAMFCTGIYGLLTRRDAIGLLLSIELMANAAGVSLVTLGWAHGARFGQVVALFVIALTVVEVGAGLALLLLLSRVKRDVSVDAIRELKG